ncbi:MAG: hypothetical protein HY596_05045 [Candidatus Omnitrophica bacterium]|nr:hypothetical protein [Candidatus Omnitrophota bacterium]
MRTERGVTLMELLLASSIGVVVLLAMAHVDVTRILVGRQAKDLSEIQAEPAFALTHLARSIVRADRVNLISSSNIQIRIPPTTGTQADLNDPTKYAWVQYRHSGTEMEIQYSTTNPCSVAARFRNISSLNIQYRDESTVPPPGGEPLGGPDNNVLEMTVKSTAADLQTGEKVSLTGEATMRSGAYTNLMTGLLPPGADNPPGSC